MAGVSIEIDGMFPMSGGIGGIAGFPVTLSIINVSMDKYNAIEENNRTYKLVHRTETQRFIVAKESKVEM